jgi:hypothetical protein
MERSAARQRSAAAFHSSVEPVSGSSPLFAMRAGLEVAPPPVPMA